MKKNYDDLAAGILFICIGIAVSTQLSAIKIKNIAMTSRMVPELCTGLLIALGAVEIVKWLIHFIKVSKTENSSSVEEKKPLDFRPYIRVAASLVLFAAFIALLKPIGFIPAGIFYLLSTFMVIVPKGYKNKIVYIVSIIFPVVTYFIFTKAFNIILPTGIIW